MTPCVSLCSPRPSFADAKKGRGYLSSRCFLIRDETRWST